jgi:hypothetical protein
MHAIAIAALKNGTYSTNMPAITLKAHFDGEHILLDEPFELAPNTPLMVMVLPATDRLDASEWSQISAAGLARAYSDDEPDYSTADIKP